jgi:Leucine-rich repeat (LRR) protein
MNRYFFALVFLFSCSDKTPDIVTTKLIENVDYCKGCNDLTDAFRIKDSVYELYLSNFTLKSFDTILAFRNLKLIQLSDCRDMNFRSFIDSISKVKSIEVLNFRSCGVNQIAENIRELSNLKSFGIEFDTVFNVSNGLFELTNLEELTLTTNKLSDSVLLLQNLKVINLNILEQEYFPGILMDLKNLEYVNVSKNTKFITSDISAFKKLKRINIGGSAYEERILKNLYSNDDRIRHRYGDSISALKKLLPINCVIVTSGNIKY